MLLGVCLEFAAIVGLYLAFHDSTPPKAEAPVHQTVPPHTLALYREWYLALLWDVHHQTPDHPALQMLYGRSDSYVENYVRSLTGETFDAAKNRITSPLGPDPSDLEIHSAVVLESYAVNGCRKRYVEPCYRLDFLHATVGNHVLAPLSGTISYSDVKAGNYKPQWGGWKIPRPPAKP